MVARHRPAPRRDRPRPRLRHRRLPRRGLQPPREAVQDGGRPAASCRSESLFGGEAKPLPYLLCQMNLLLHGLEAPQIDPRQRPALQAAPRSATGTAWTSSSPIRPSAARRRGASRATSPTTSRPSETALLFLQLIMRKLRRRPTPAERPAAPPSSCPTARSSATASAPASRRNCSRSSTSTPSSACPTASSRPTPASRPTCSSSTAPARRRTSGTTSSRCPKAGRTTPRRSRSSSRSSPPCHGLVEQAQGERPRLEGAGRRPARRRLQPRPQEPARARRTSPTCRRSNSPTSILEKEQRIAEIMGNIQKLLAGGGGS